MRRVALLVAVVMGSPGLLPALELSPLFGHNAVLQRDQALPVWGQDEAGAMVRVEFAGQEVEVVADGDRAWKAVLKPIPLNKEPQELKVSSGDKSIVRRGILMGDVWLCSGQSNMGQNFQMARLPTDEPDFFQPENLAMVRQLKVGRLKTRKTAPEILNHPQKTFQKDQIKGDWVICDGESYKGFSATALFFANDVHQAGTLPVYGPLKVRGFGFIDSGCHLLSCKQRVTELAR